MVTIVERVFQLVARKSSDTLKRAVWNEVDDTLRPKVLRFIAFLMICGAGLNVLPAAAAQSVGNCLALLDAQQPFMVKAGCSRLQLLMRLEAARRKAADIGAAGKLLRLVRPNADAGGCGGRASITGQACLQPVPGARKAAVLAL